MGNVRLILAFLIFFGPDSYTCRANLKWKLSFRIRTFWSYDTKKPCIWWLAVGHDCNIFFSHLYSVVRSSGITLNKLPPTWLRTVVQNYHYFVLSADGFKVATDHTRASFRYTDLLSLFDYRIKCKCQFQKFHVFSPFAPLSPDGQYVICGSHDGSIFVWDASTAKLEKVLKEHR